MKSSNSHHRQSLAGRRSSTLAVNPYFLADTALTSCGLDRVRSHQIAFVQPASPESTQRESHVQP